MTHRVTDDFGRFWRDVDEARKTSALPGEAVTLAEVLRASGYETGAWVANGWITAKLGFAQGFDEFQFAGDGESPFDGKEVWAPAWKWIDAREGGKPFFAYLHFMDTHGPWLWQEADAEALRDSPSLGKDRELGKGETEWAAKLCRDEKAPDPGSHLRSWRAAYAAAVRQLDRRLGRLLDKLSSAGLLDDTIVVFTADHGEELLDHGRWGHGESLHAHQTHVPLIVRLPGAEGAGRRVEAVVSLIDLMPTLLQAAGVEHPPSRMQGESLWDLVLGRAGAPARSGWALSGAMELREHVYSLQNDRRKLVWDPEGMSEYSLYDLKNDPGERVNLAGLDAERVASMSERLKSMLHDLEAGGTLLDEKGELTDEEMKKLESLGYVH